MTYNKTLWKDRIVERPLTYTEVANPDGSKTLVPAEGQIIEVGTPVTAANMNKIENGLGDVTTQVISHVAENTKHIRYGTATGANAKVITIEDVNNYVEGLAIAFRNETENTGAVTLNVNSLGARTVLRGNGTAITAGMLKVDSIYTVRFNGTNFILQGEGGSGNALASDLLLGKTASTDAGDIVGIIPSLGAQTITPSTVNQTIASGQFLSGVQTIAGSPNLVTGNIRNGVNIFGVVGTFLGLPITSQSGTAQTLRYFHDAIDVPFSGSNTYQTIATYTIKNLLNVSRDNGGSWSRILEVTSGSNVSAVFTRFLVNGVPYNTVGPISAQSGGITMDVGVVLNPNTVITVQAYKTTTTTNFSLRTGILFRPVFPYDEA